MNTTSYLTEDSALARSLSPNKKYRFSFSSFHQAIKANSELRKQIKDIVDLGLFEYALQRNTAFIQAVREKAESESIELMMRFAYGTDDYESLKRMIHRNRIIRTLAIMDRKAQLELMNLINHFKA